MESIKNIINMLKSAMFLASTDIKDAFYSVLIFLGHRKYLRFICKGKIYQFLAMLNGYIYAMWISNKLLKPDLPLYMNLVMNHLFIWMIVY